MEKPVTRGVRNNNPFNIKINSNNHWEGRVPLSLNEDGTFEQFVSMGWGVRAGMVLLRNYITKGYDTPRKIISKFAPASENNIKAYELFISGSLGLDDVIIWRTFPFYMLCRLICDYESNKLFTINYFKNIVKLYQL